MELLARLPPSLLRQTILCAAFLAAFGWHQVVSASPKSASKLYAEGIRLYAEENYSEAATALEKSYSLDESQATLFAWAQSERLQQHCDKASDLFESFISKGSDAKQLKAAFQLIKQCEKDRDSEADEPLEPIPVTPDPSEQTSLTTSVEPHQASVPLYLRWQVYMGGSLLAVAGGTYFGLRAQSIADEAETLPDGTEFSRVQILQNRAEKSALYANISFVSAGVLGIGALWMYWQQPQVPNRGEAISIAPSFTPGELRVSLQGAF